MQAVILAGGRGTRLGTLTEITPKPLIPVRGKPFLEWIILRLRCSQITRILLCTGYRHGQIADYFGDGYRWGVSICYSMEQTPLGTGGALANAQTFIEDPFMVINADTYNDIDYDQLQRSFQEGSLKGLILASAEPEGIYRKNLVVDESSWLVKGYGYDLNAGTNYLDCGIKVFSKKIFSHMNLPRPFSLEEEVLNRLARERSLKAHPSNHKILDIGTPEQLKRAELLLPIESLS